MDKKIVLITVTFEVPMSDLDSLLTEAVNILKNQVLDNQPYSWRLEDVDNND